MEVHDEEAWDRAGCFWSLLRFSIGWTILYAIMGLAILAVALFSLLLFH
ncbi:MAG: hypothetical protein GX539_13940 [Candidatus Cloacimonetes bacterium]|nr:hypothetical protein [Candidatus Cloacimonadota bacterium]